MKLGIPAGAALIILSLAAVGAAPLRPPEAGKYWVNISQTGPNTYTINLAISAGEALQVRTVRAPAIVDASELATRIEIRALAEAQVTIPISFIGEGAGRLWIAINSVDDAEKTQYLVFDAFNEVRGSEISDRIADAVGRWQELSTSSVMQFGRTPVKCDKDLRDNILQTGLFGERKALNGVVFIGSAPALDGKISGFNGDNWGLQFIGTRVGRVASFIEVGELPPLQRETANRDNSATGSDNTPAENQTSERNDTPRRENGESAPGQQTRQTQSGATGSDPGTKQPEPKSGPYAGAGPSVAIHGLSVRKDWVAAAGSEGGSGAGHFGETVVSLPEEFSHLSRVDSVELVLEIKPVGTAPAMGRISISATPMLANARPSGVWFAEKYVQQGELLGEFDLRYDGPEYRFDITNLVRSNPAGRYFVSVLNLSRTALNIVNIRLEVKGQY